MNLREDYTLSLRALIASPLESLLLVIGLALSIGATASGLGMLEKANREGDALLEQAEYREIVVSSRVSGDEMDNSTQLKLTDEDITLSVDDLSAASISPDIAYSYLANRTRLRFNTGDFDFRPPDQQQATDTESQPTQESVSNSGSTPTTTSVAETPSVLDPSNDTATDQPEQRDEFRPPEIEMAEVDGAQPILDEVSGYEVTTEFFQAMNFDIDQGSTFTDQDMTNAAKVLVLGSELAKTLFEDGESLGRQVASFDRIYTIVGILESTDTNYDNMIFMPSELLSDSTAAAVRRRPGGFDATLHFAVTDVAQLNNAADQLQGWFDSTYGSDVLNISVPREEAQRAIDRTENMAIITLVLAMAGLLIASVNVSNILYGRALRRRKQIGILKALGASRRNIFNLFFAEGGIILAFGALLGVVIVILFSMLLANAGEGSLAVTAALIGILLSSIITLAFTIVPALQATQVQPAIAMRTE